MLLEHIILILDSRGTESSHFQSIVEQDSNIQVITVDKLENAGEIIEKYEPDIILAYDNFKKNIVDICSQIRMKQNLYRSTLIVLSEEQPLENRLEIIKTGADDIQNISIDKKEISARIFAHLRRQMEELSDPVTKLPVTNALYKVIKRNIVLENNDFIAVMYIDVNNFVQYKEIYGYIAAEKLIQTFIAIVSTAINENDFFGQVNENGFVILTKPEKAEKIATFLSYSFDTVAPKFYSHEDIERGYLLVAGDDKIGRRIPFVSVSIGIVSNQYKSFSSFQEVINSGRNIQRLAKSRLGSYWISDRPKIPGGDIVEKVQNKILIAEKDAALAYLLSTTLEMQGYSVEIINKDDEIIDYVKSNEVNLIILDITEENSYKELEICKIIKKEKPDITIIISTVDRNKEKILDSGADLYIPKPYELMTLFNWIYIFLNNKL